MDLKQPIDYVNELRELLIERAIDAMREAIDLDCRRVPENVRDYLLVAGDNIAAAIRKAKP